MTNPTASETITGVAILDEQGRLWSLPAPHRHSHIFALAAFVNTRADGSMRGQGFTTNTGRFVDRADGLDIAKAAGQTRPGAALGHQLYSGFDVASASVRPEPWQGIASAPKDGKPFEALYDDGSVEEGVYWAEERYCILGAPQGSKGPGCMSTEVGLPVDPTHWRLVSSGQNLADAHSKSPSRPAMPKEAGE